MFKTLLVLLFSFSVSSLFAQNYKAVVGLKIAGTATHLTYNGKDLDPTGGSMPDDYGTKVSVFPAVVCEFVNKTRPLYPVSYDLQLSFRNPGSFSVDNGVTSPTDSKPRYEYKAAAKFLRFDVGARFHFLNASSIKPYLRPLIGIQYTVSQSTKAIMTGSGSSVEGNFVTLKKPGFAFGLSAGVSTTKVDFELGYEVCSVAVQWPIGKGFGYDLGHYLYKTFYFGVVMKPFSY